MLTIAERRQVADRSAEPDFRDLLRSDPRKAIISATGRSLPDAATVALVEESADAWSFVLVNPADIEAVLPDPLDARSAVDNQVYALLRDEPALADAAERDPIAFLRERFGVEVPAVDVRREGAGETLLVVPHLAAREELSDELLDMVAGGGEPGCQSGFSSQKRGNGGFG